MKFLLASISLFLLINCKTQNTETQNPLDKNTYTPELNSDYTALYNENRTLILYYKVEQSKNDPAKHFTYYIEKSNDGSKIYEGTYRGENITWYNNNSLALTPYVGIIEKQDDYILEDDIKEANQNKNIQILKIN